MDEWSPKLKLLSVLAATHAQLLNSAEEGWTDVKPMEAACIAEQMIGHLFDPTRELPYDWLILFAPTGPAQEIAMANGWHDAYLKLAAEFDNLDYLLKGDKSVSKRS